MWYRQVKVFWCILTFYSPNVLYRSPWKRQKTERFGRSSHCELNHISLRMFRLSNGEYVKKACNVLLLLVCFWYWSWQVYLKKKKEVKIDVSHTNAIGMCLYRNINSKQWPAGSIAGVVNFSNFWKALYKKCKFLDISRTFQKIFFCCNFRMPRKSLLELASITNQKVLS